jgi:hypothetical protein
MRVLALCALVWTAGTLSAQRQAKPDFRQTRWGMTKTEVRAVEKAEPTKDPADDTYLLYRDSVASLPCTLAYVFANDQLVRALYVDDQEHANPNGYVSDYLHLKQVLTEEYGQPAEDEEVWSNDLYKDKPAEYGRAVSLGHLKRFTAWKTGTTEINIFLTGNQFKVDLSIDYSRIGHGPNHTARKTS